MDLFPHQQNIINDNPNKALLALGTGSGKTRTCLHLAMGKTLVICPKQQRDDRTWEKNAEKFEINIDLTVLSKEEFRRDHKNLTYFDTIIVDEVHNMLGLLPEMRTRKGVRVPKASQLFEAMLWYVKFYEPERMYLVSATPVSKPMHLFALGVLFGRWPMGAFVQFRDKYYAERYMGLRQIWVPKRTVSLSMKLAELTKSFGYTGQLEDWFEVPEQKHETIYVDLTTEQKQALDKIAREDGDPMGKRAKSRAIENGVLYTVRAVKISEKEEKLEKETIYYDSEKLLQIKKISAQYPKIIIFACYTGQIEAIRRRLELENFKVWTLTGQSKAKDRKTIIESCEKADQSILIVQSSISAGWEVKSCRCMIFASKSYRYVDYKQALGRNLRADNLDIAHNVYYHLVVKGGMDEACHKTILAGEDFQEKVMEQV